MLSIPEIADNLIQNLQSQKCDVNSRTILLVGSKNVGKTTILYSFLDKNEVPRETLVLEYSFGRKINQKLGTEKQVCHVWEYGGKQEVLNNVLTSVPVKGMFFYCIMIDLSKIRSIWNTLEMCIQTLSEHKDSENKPEIIIIGGKYDLFKNYDSEIKKAVCVTMRSVALLYDAHLIYYSSKEPQLLRRAKDMFYNIGFGSGVPFKEKITNSSKPLCIPKSSDTWENMEIPKATLEQIKLQHFSKFPMEVENVELGGNNVQTQRSHPEPSLDMLVKLKYKELLTSDTLDITVHDYLSSLM